MTSPSSGARNLTLDEPSFQKLLSAAYALQQNKDVLQAGSSENDSASVFSQIAALRSQILAHVDTAELKAVNRKEARAKPAAEAAALVAESLLRLTNADGASVCLIIDGYLRPTACSGSIAKVSGGSVASNSLVATERLRNGRPFQSANACSDIRLGPSLCVELQIGSLLAFPIERQNEIAGLIEVRWSKADAFSDGDEHICQLMADLMGEVLEDEDGKVKAQLTQPVQVTAPVNSLAEKATSVAKSETQDQELSSGPAIVDRPVPEFGRVCRVCGKPLSGDLNFCGNCGMLSSSPETGIQGKWASMWFMQQAQKTVETATVETGEDRGERLWPLHAAKTQTKNPPTTTAPNSPNEKLSVVSNNQPEIQETSETADVIADLKRSPRRVLSALKSRFKARAIGQ